MLNRAQKIILWCGVLACCFVIFVRPPLRAIDVSYFMVNRTFSDTRYVLDVARLLSYLAGIGIATTAAMATAAGPRRLA